MKTFLFGALLVIAGCETASPVTNPDGGPPDAGVRCSAGQTTCADECIDTRRDHDHCGACDHACPPNEVCWQSSCATSCGAGTTQCGQTCRDLAIDPSNCGACGNACQNGMVCFKGSCQTSCGPGTTQCDQSCVDTQVDPDHCGDCSTLCDPGFVCSKGKCASICVQGQTMCTANGTTFCTNIGTDVANCGSCGNACSAKMFCASGTCTCFPGLYNCNGCVSLDTDSNNCGKCNSKCAGVCTSGRCIETLASNLVQPTGIVADPQYVYVVDEGAGTVNKVSVNGGNVTVLASQQTQPHAITADSSYVYWGSLTGVYKVPVNGGNATQLATTSNSNVYDIITDVSNVYWTEDQRVMQAPSNVGAPVVLATSWMNRGIQTDGAYVYWSSGTNNYGIAKVPVGGGNATTLVKFTSSSSSLVILNGLCWAEYNAIECVNTNSANVWPLALAQGAVDLVVDGTYNWIYFPINAQFGSIARAPLNGGNVETIVANQTNPRRIAASLNAVFWTIGNSVMKVTQ